MADQVQMYNVAEYMTVGLCFRNNFQDCERFNIYSNCSTKQQFTQMCKDFANLFIKFGIIDSFDISKLQRPTQSCKALASDSSIKTTDAKSLSPENVLKKYGYPKTSLNKPLIEEVLGDIVYIFLHYGATDSFHTDELHEMVMNTAFAESCNFRTRKIIYDGIHLRGIKD